jgi:hypothetical protein
MEAEGEELLAAGAQAFEQVADGAGYIALGPTQELLDINDFINRRD